MGGARSHSTAAFVRIHPEAAYAIRKNDMARLPSSTSVDTSVPAKIRALSAGAPKSSTACANPAAKNAAANPATVINRLRIALSMLANVADQRRRKAAQLLRKQKV